MSLGNGSPWFKVSTRARLSEVEKSDARWGANCGSALRILVAHGPRSPAIWSR